MKGYVQIYTGDGKGKTTAALGLILRASGAGLRIFLGQFIKGRSYSEIKALAQHLPKVTVEQFGSGHFIRGTPAPDAIQKAKHGLARIHEVLVSGKYDVVIADEIHCCVSCGLFSPEDVIHCIQARPGNVEFVLTGRNAHRKVMKHAHLITTMKSTRHYYDKGIQARRGIEF